MLNRLLIVVHWFLFVWGLGMFLGLIWSLLNGGYIKISDFLELETGIVLAVVYPIALWIIKHRWIWFPWQHGKD